MDIEHLGAVARAEHYRSMARAQMELASKAGPPEMRAVCLELAAMWTRLAEAAERLAAGRPPARDDQASTG